MNDFSKGKVWRHIVSQSIPLMLAELVYLLYNIVDRIYIGHLDVAGNMALTGVGLTFPIVTLIAAFTALFGKGGTPLFSIARGAKDEEQAERIMGNTFFMLLVSSVLLLVICYIFCKPILYLFGASDASYPYANAYLRIYLLGTPCAMLSVGMNGFISAQGFPKTGMLTTVIGAILNLILDPIFIFVLDMGVAGAALATVISQMVSALWVLAFLVGKKALLRLKRIYIRNDWTTAKPIMALGSSACIVQATNSLVQIVCNVTLQTFGGDLYVGIMTVLNSVREIFWLPISGINSGAQPVMGYNYGAKENERVKQSIRFTALIGMAYTVLAWILILVIPKTLFMVFTKDGAVIDKGVEALGIYFFGFCFMSFQFAGQTVFQALGRAKEAIFFSLLRKVVIVVPLTLLLPVLGLGVNGVFLAEPISNAVGGIACFVTMWKIIYKKL